MPQALAYDKSARTFDVDGRMHVVRCRISKANICPYRGWEIPNNEALGLDPQQTYYLYRDPVELAAAAPSFRNIPLLIRHVPISADAPERDSWVGTTGSEVEFDGTYLVTNILSVWTAEAITLVESGQQEQLSSSYRYTADMTPGELNGVRYDGVMRNIIGNHVAIVEQGRAGPDVVVADSKLPPERSPMKPKRSALALALAALLPAATPAQLLAVDQALDESCEKAWDGWSEEEKKAAQDAWREEKGMGASDAMSDEEEAACWKSAKDKRAKDAAPRAADAAPPVRQPAPTLTQADVQRQVKLAEDGAVARVTALYNAKDAVRPYVGEVVACDSAAAVYRFALGKLGETELDSVPDAALPRMFSLAAKAHSAQRAVPRNNPPPAMDAAGAQSLHQALPGLVNITVAH